VGKVLVEIDRGDGFVLLRDAGEHLAPILTAFTCNEALSRERLAAKKMRGSNNHDLHRT
jgi:hypothetical protein